MKKYISFALLLATLMANAEGQAIRLIQPQGTASELKLAELRGKDDLFAKFTGEAWVSGTFVARWPAGAGALAIKNPDYVLVPDQASIARLPYFVINDPPYKNSYKVRGIEILNGEDALHLAFSDVLIEKILERKTDSTSVTGNFLIQSYVVGVECDAPWARAVLVKTDLPDQLTQVHRKVQETC